MSERFPICTMKWTPPNRKTDSQRVFNYQDQGITAANTLYSELCANVNIPFRFLYITDEDKPRGLNSGISAYRMPECLDNMEATWRKTILFSESMKEIAGDRFCYMDLDVIVTSDITPLLQYTDPVILTRFYKTGVRNRNSRGKRTYERLNSCFMIMDTGVYPQVWNTFPLSLSECTSRTKPLYLAKYFGCDQSWISHQLKEELDNNRIRFLTSDDGIYTCRHLREAGYTDSLPDNTRIVAFGGKDHPTSSETRNKTPWIKKYRP